MVSQGLFQTEESCYVGKGCVALEAPGGKTAGTRLLLPAEEGFSISQNSSNKECAALRGGDLPSPERRLQEGNHGWRAGPEAGFGDTGAEMRLHTVEESGSTASRSLCQALQGSDGYPRNTWQWKSRP